MWPESGIHLSMDRLNLGRLTLDDAEALYELDGDPAIMRFISIEGTPLENIRDVLLLRFTHRYDQSSGFGRDAWGKGLATEGSIALIDRAFSDPRVDSVMAQTMAVNTASRRVMEKCGMRFVRTFHLDFDNPVAGTEAGEVEYESTREMWMKRQERPIRSEGC